jgi:hypothetical protein
VTNTRTRFIREFRKVDGQNRKKNNNKLLYNKPQSNAYIPGKPLKSKINKFVNIMEINSDFAANSQAKTIE